MTRYGLFMGILRYAKDVLRRGGILATPMIVSLGALASGLLDAPDTWARPAFGDPRVKAVSAQAPGDSLESLLHAYEAVPTTEELTRNRSPRDVVDRLDAIATDQRKPAWLRARAASALGKIPAPEAVAALTRIIERPSAQSSPVSGGRSETSVTRAALLAFGAQRAAPGTLYAFLVHPQSAIREAAVISLGRYDTPEVRLRLERAAEAETDAHIAERLDRVLDRSPTRRKRSDHQRRGAP